MAKFDLITTLLLNIAGFTGGINQVKQQTKELVDTIKSVESKLGGIASFAGGLLAVGGAFETIKTAINSTQGSADSFREVIAGIGAATDSFFRSIITGDMANFADNMVKAAVGAADFEAALDEIKKRKLGSSLNLTEAAPELTQLLTTAKTRIDDNNKAVDPQVRLDALIKYKKEKKELDDGDLAIANKLLEKNREYLVSQGTNDKQLEEYYRNMGANIPNIDKTKSDLAAIHKLEVSRKVAGGSANTAMSGMGVIEPKESHQIVANYQKEIDDLYAGMDDNERHYIDLVKNDDKTKEQNVINFIDSLKGVAIAKNEIAAVDLETTKVEGGIRKDIANDEKKNADSIQKLKAKALEDSLNGYFQEKQIINDKYDGEITKANGNAVLLKQIEITRQSEMAALNQKYLVIDVNNIKTEIDNDKLRGVNNKTIIQEERALLDLINNDLKNEKLTTAQQNELLKVQKELTNDIYNIENDRWQLKKAQIDAETKEYDNVQKYMLNSELRANQTAYDEKLKSFKKYIADERKLKLDAIDKDNTLTPREKEAKKGDVNSEEDQKIAVHNMKIEQQAVDQLSGAFETLFQGGKDGWKNLMKSMVQFFEKMVAELLAIAAVFAVLKLIGVDVGTFSSFFGKMFHAANGGIVGGTSFSGDHIPAMLNSGEAVLTVDQQKNMFGGGVLTTKVSGTDLMIVLNNTQRRSNSFA